MNNSTGRNSNSRYSRRSRGRSSNRKPPNPLTRSYESNGPDVKVRGTASNVAEKYQQLARDALASGDTIAAENYLQHAEHYLRIIATAQAQQADERAADNQEERGSDDRSAESRGEGRRSDRGRNRNGSAESHGRDRDQASGGASQASDDDADKQTAELSSMPAFLRNGPGATSDDDAPTDGDGGGAGSDDSTAHAVNGAGADVAVSDDEDSDKPVKRPRRRTPRKPAADHDAAGDGEAAPDA